MKTIRNPVIAAIAIGLLAGSGVGVAAQDAATEFTGRWAVGSQALPDTEEPGDGWELTTGGAWQVSTLEMSDPRFDGDIVVYTNWYDVNPGTTESMDVRKSMWQIENEDGSWQSDVLGGVDFPGAPGKSQFHIFEGAGAYDGLTAVVELDMHGQLTDLHGVIFDFALPPDPEPRSVE